MYQWELAFGNTARIPSAIATLGGQLNSLGCTYSFDCKDGAGSVQVLRPRISFTFVVATQCKNVDWTTLRTKIETGIVSRGVGRAGGVNFKWNDMKNDATANTCVVLSSHN